MNLKRVLAEARAMGFTMNVGTEAEFFLFKLDDKGQSTTQTDDNAGYFSLDPEDTGLNCRREIIETLEIMGFEIEASHHEVAEGQHEINFKYADALTCADNTLTFKWVVKSIAKKTRSPCHLHAQTHLRHQRIRHAHQPVPVQPGRHQRLCR